jgi:hypothetical protein
MHLRATIFRFGGYGGQRGKDESLEILTSGKFVRDLLLGGGYACFCIFTHPSFEEVRFALEGDFVYPVQWVGGVEVFGLVKCVEEEAVTYRCIGPLIPEQTRKTHLLLNGIQTIPSIAKKAVWTLQCATNNHTPMEKGS